MDGARGDGRARRRRSLFARRARSARSARCRRMLRLGVPRAGQLLFFGDKPLEAAYDAALERLDRARLRRSSRSTSSRSTRPRGCSMTGPGSPSATLARARCSPRDPDAIHPVTRDIISPARGSSAARRLRGVLPAARGCAASPSASLPHRSTRWRCRRRRPSTPSRRSLADPIAAQQPARHLYQFRQPARPLRPRAAGGDAAETGMPFGITLLAPAGARRAAGRASAASFHADTQAPAGRARPAAAGARAACDAAGAGRRSPSPWSARISPACRSTANCARSAAVCLKSPTTAPDYRLYALTGRTPAKARPAAGGATAKASPSRSRSGRCRPPRSAVSSPPCQPPLSIGTVALADGRTVKGFPGRSRRYSRARDISDFGGWRAFCAGESAGLVVIPGRREAATPKSKAMCALPASLDRARAFSATPTAAAPQIVFV